MHHKILLVDDEDNILKVLSAILKKDGNSVVTCNNGNEALKLLENDIFDLLITDLKMPKMDGIELLKLVKEKFSDIEVILMTAHGTIETAVKAMKFGAIDYILKPFDQDEIKIRVKTAINSSKFKQQEIKYFSIEKNLTKIVGNSNSMEQIYSVIKSVANIDSTILITGETGTGKELIAKEIHQSGFRKNEPFIAINCAAIPENLLESELFGHEKGSFTGSIEKRTGRFEIANNGTLFLDEIGDMNINMQVKLLRVLQEKKIERIGNSESISFNARIIAATNKNLEIAIKDGKFREDLYYRLNVIPIIVPPLRNHKEDIKDLIEYFLFHFCKKFNKHIIKFTEQAFNVFINYSWPGNIRELENTIERLVALNKKDTLDFEDLPENIRNISINLLDKTILKNSSNQKEIIKKYLLDFNNNRTKTANALGISRRSLINKIKEFGL